MRHLWGCFQNSNITLVINSHEFWAHCSKTLLVMNYLQGAQELRAAHGNPENIGHSVLCGCSVHPVKYSPEMLRETNQKNTSENFSFVSVQSYG